MILDDIIKKKKLQLDEEMKLIPLDGLKELLKKPDILPPLDFSGALKSSGLSIIAEVKKASPSKGMIREDFHPLEIAREYYAAGVQAISVLTEKNFFMGSDEHLAEIKKAIPLPVLRKDFIIDLWQAYQSRCLGADAILLIVSILTDDELKSFQDAARALGMQCLVEVHDEAELERALESGAIIIGINNRDLKTFEVDLRTTGKLMKHMPAGRIVVSESGIKTAADMRYLKNLGVDAVLIGETFLRSGSIQEKIRELRVH